MTDIHDIIDGESRTFEPGNIRPPDLSEDDLALRFHERHGEDLRFNHDRGRWMTWTGTHWQIDRTSRGLDLARAICRQASTEAETKHRATKLTSAATVGAVEKLAKVDQRLAITADDLDQDRWLLNTPTETILLGAQPVRWREHRREDHCTKITAFGIGDNLDKDAPTWRAFVDQVTDGDRALQAFLQRVAGYCLCGSTREHAMFFLFGGGANGKSTFVNTIKAVMGSYATTTDAELLMASNIPQHPTGLADLHGARLVIASETEQGRRWAESKLKNITGGDPVKARFMRQDNFQFDPQFKLIISGNHKPGLRGVDEAMRRRLNLVPFTVTIPEHERDEKLPAKLLEEGPGILWWMVNGFAEWSATGLQPPSAVTDATDEYLGSEDVIARWIDECVKQDTGTFTLTSDLWAAYQTYCKDGGEYGGKRKHFKNALEGHGLVSGREPGRGRYGFENVGL